MRKGIYIKKLVKKVLELLNDAKSVNIEVIDVGNRSSIADFIIITEGNSSRHVNSIVGRLSKELKNKILSIEGLPRADWALVDLGDLIIHVFKPEVRQYYNLEKLWDLGAPEEKQKINKL